MAKKRKISQAEFSKRLWELESVYGQKELSHILGISKDSIRRYKEGKTTPKSQKVYEKINKTYSKNKSKVNPQEAQQYKEKIIHKREKAKETGLNKVRYTSIYPGYMSYSPFSDYYGIPGQEQLTNLQESGYVAAWKGSEEIPLEVQFMIRGDNFNKVGRHINIVTIMQGNYTTTAKNGFEMIGAYLNIYRTDRIFIREYIKAENFRTASFDERNETLRNFMFNVVKLKDQKGNLKLPIEYIGYFWDEDDEV